MTQEIQAVLEFLSPVELVWHKEQAGIIPNCRQQRGCTSKEQPKEVPEEKSKPLLREQLSSQEECVYWQLYESLAAYRMAVHKESEKEEMPSETKPPYPVTYDWILGTRFDVAWARPLPSLRAFSQDVVWLDTKSW